MRPSQLAPMLASTSAPAEGFDERWWLEVKLDGWRVIVTVDGEKLVVRTRNGHDITAAVPEVEPLRDLGLHVVLDGELVAGDGSVSSFHSLAGRLAGRRPRRVQPAACVMAFDVLWADGEVLTRRSYVDRRLVLEGLELGPVPAVPRYPSAELHDWLEACEQRGMEGVVLKRADSPYVPGRRTTLWRKAKCPTARVVIAARMDRAHR